MIHSIRLHKQENFSIAKYHSYSDEKSELGDVLCELFPDRGEGGGGVGGREDFCEAASSEDVAFEAVVFSAACSVAFL